MFAPLVHGVDEQNLTEICCVYVAVQKFSANEAAVALWGNWMSRLLSEIYPSCGRAIRGGQPWQNYSITQSQGGFARVTVCLPPYQRLFLMFRGRTHGQQRQSRRIS